MFFLVVRGAKQISNRYEVYNFNRTGLSNCCTFSVSKYILLDIVCAFKVMYCRMAENKQATAAREVHRRDGLRGATSSCSVLYVTFYHFAISFI